MPDRKIITGRSKIVTTFILTVVILFCTELFEPNTADQRAFAQLNAGNPESSPQYIVINSNTKWAGSILDSSQDSTIVGSYGDTKFDIDCHDGWGPYTAVFSKEGGLGYLTISLVENGKTVATETTTDSFGGVEVSGNCA